MSDRRIEQGAPLSHELVDLLALDERTRDAIFADAVRVMREFNPGHEVERYRATYAAQRVHRSKGVLLRTGDEVVGFQFVAAHDLRVDGKRYTIIRSTVAKSSRLHGVPRPFDRFGPRMMIGMALGAWLRGRTPWVLATSESPVTYLRATSFLRSIVPPPDPEREPPAKDLETFHALARAYGYELDGDLPYATRTGPKQRLSAEQLARWRARDDMEIQRVFASSPEIGQGQALLFGGRLGLGNLTSMPLAAWRRRAARRRTQRRLGAATPRPTPIEA